MPSPMEVEDSGSNAKGDDNTVSLSDQLDGPQDDKVNGSEEEEEDVDMLLDAAGSEPKAKEEIRGWKELREQIKDDLLKAYREKNKMCTRANQLTILRNFMTLRIKQLGHINMSKEITRQWHEGEGVHFAHRICFLARHYQLSHQNARWRQGPFSVE